jgi:hypothetical protein
MLTVAQNFAFVPMIYFLFPETKGLSLEQIDYLFFKGNVLPDDNASSQSDSEARVDDKRAHGSAHEEKL